MIWPFNFFFKKYPAPATVWIDDSGLGSLYGGAIILLTDGENDYYGEIPVKVYWIQDKEERKKKVESEVVKIIKKGLKALHVNKKATEIFTCRGPVFDGPMAKFKKMGYKIARVKIEGRANDEAENVFEKILKERYKIEVKNRKDHRGENIKQYDTLRKRRDFKNVKQSSRGVAEIMSIKA